MPRRSTPPGDDAARPRGLFDWAAEQRLRGRRSIAERFAAFHDTNPWVYRELVRLARTAKERGFPRWSIEALYVILRWERSARPTDQSSQFKLNDQYTSRYARLIEQQEPDLRGFFELRRLRSEA